MYHPRIMVLIWTSIRSCDPSITWLFESKCRRSQWIMDHDGPSIGRNDWVYELILTYLLNWIAYYISMRVNELRLWVNNIKTCLVLSLNNFYVPYCKYFGSQFLICITETLFKQNESHTEAVLSIVWKRATWTALIYPTVR